MLVNPQNLTLKKPRFAKISAVSSDLQNDLLNHRVHGDFKTQTVEYRLRLLPLSAETTPQDKQHLQIDFTWQGQSGVAFCESSLVTALFDLEASDFDVRKLTAVEQNAAFRVIQRMITENTPAVSGLVIQQMQLANFKIDPQSPLQLAIKVTSVEHFSYIHLQLGAAYRELLLPLIQQAPAAPSTNTGPAVSFTQDLEVHGCFLNQRELSSLEIGDVVMFDQSATDYRIRLQENCCFGLSSSENGLSLLPILATENHTDGSLFELFIKLHQAYVNDAEDDSIIQVAQQQLEHSQQQPLKMLYCNDKPFAMAEGMYIGDRFGMRLQSFL